MYIKKLINYNSVFFTYIIFLRQFYSKYDRILLSNIWDLFLKECNEQSYSPDLELKYK